MEAVSEPPQFSLWFRRKTRSKWRRLFTGTNEECGADLGQRMRRREAGDWITMLVYGNPNEKVVTRAADRL